uniref:Sentan, cilia apical structure protein n=1 Tax=Zonotrichia albicollis TaxID=44394 RepID=A0A8D2M3U1_ZONAL
MATSRLLPRGRASIHLLAITPLPGDHKQPGLEMCGCRTSVPSMKQYSVSQPAPAATKKGPPAAAGMPKGVPVAKQLASIKALRKGSDLEKAFATAALVYNNHADPESKLSKSETKSLLQSQFWHFIQVRGPAGWVALGQPWALWVQEWQLRLSPAAWPASLSPWGIPRDT